MKKAKMIEISRKRKATAMPFVKKLVKRFGRTAIQSCLTSLRDYEKIISKLVDVRREVARLERELKKTP